MNDTAHHVHLRAMEPEDLDMLYLIENDQQLWGLGVSNVPYSRYTLHDYIAHAAADIYTDRQVRLIIENDSQQAVGICDLVNFDPQHRRAEIGMVIRREFRRQGCAGAALCSLQRYALRVLHLHQLYAVIDAENQPALSLFLKTGFSQAATLPDWLYDGREYRRAVLMQKLL